MIGAMDLSRLPAITPQPPASAPASRDVKAAQRAFFQAALGQVEAAPAAPPPPEKVASAPAEAPQDRILRPGSLVDIRV